MKQSYNYSSNRNRKSNRNYSPADGHANVSWRLLYEWHAPPIYWLTLQNHHTSQAFVHMLWRHLAFVLPTFRRFFFALCPPPHFANFVATCYSSSSLAFLLYVCRFFTLYLGHFSNFCQFLEGARHYHHTYNVSVVVRRGLECRVLSLAKLHCNVSNSSFLSLYGAF